MVQVDPTTADIPALADFVARWLDGLRDWCPRCQGTGREDHKDPYSPRSSCPRCLGRLWVSVIDVERLLEAIAAVGPLEVEVSYPGRGARACLLRLYGDRLQVDRLHCQSTTGARTTPPSAPSTAPPPPSWPRCWTPASSRSSPLTNPATDHS